MAMNLPTGVPNGTVIGNYTYDSSVPGWRKTPEVASGLPAGSIMQWGAVTPPANWLICDGSAVSRTTYASLFAAIGVQYGSGDGSTTFNLPNLKGKVAVGLDSSQTEFDTLGETGGAKTHTLTSSEVPSHTHTYSGTSSTDGAHTHTVHETWSDANTTHNHGSSGGYVAQGQTIARGGTYDDPNVVVSAGSHSHTYSGTTSSSGSGGAHNNLQPYIVLNYIIKTSAGITSGDSELATRVGVVESQNNLTPLSQNYIINGGFDIWQRGTSFSASGYTADRWTGDFVTGAGSVSRQSFTPGSAPVAGYEGQYFLRRSVTTGAQFSSLIHRVEDVRTLSGQTVTLSFWAKGTNPTGNFSVVLIQNFGSGGSSDVVTGLPTLTLTGSWVRYTATVTLPSMSGKTIGANSFLWLSIYQAAANTSASTLDIWGVQLEEGSYATPFRRNAPSLQAELAGCQRYAYVKNGSSTDSMWGTGRWEGNGFFCALQHPVPMRTVPSYTLLNPTGLKVVDPTVAWYQVSAIGSIHMNGTTAADVFFTMSGASVTNKTFGIMSVHSGSPQLIVSAEL